ncbi:MAG: hypothetical protein U0L43_08600 [Muribaculaceae bacterium]|nr:hypothetical protein [Muribaculaceae bacterium]
MKNDVVFSVKQSLTKRNNYEEIDHLATDNRYGVRIFGPDLCADNVHGEYGEDAQ